ncbi:hypothetical protein FHW67_004212 [Herbaspirillum sp. Sphag1AN]|uniref:hypothetical protein n=1 Tax=unclassified Herbaspirillum TaxID=2624150 RepID=UPI00160E315D|nr:MULTISPECIES: hypothetical protein [unclassified Herbaspirillum]MBB3214888.1 hypothetical protein [Herbaspirillum sp. Sphag1AN]MBB3248082.1 hypothetical protein [Herbaspirillum sp. Sphag64]
MFNQILLLIYRLFLSEGRRRVNWIEKRFGFDASIALSCDDKRNEPGTYETLFSQEHQEKLKQLYLELLNEMNGVTYQQCGDVLDALEFIQEISAAGLWKYRQRVDVIIEEFVRDFDRLDVPEERIRLYESVQKH